MKKKQARKNDVPLNLEVRKRSVRTICSASDEPYAFEDIALQVPRWDTPVDTWHLCIN